MQISIRKEASRGMLVDKAELISKGSREHHYSRQRSRRASRKRRHRVLFRRCRAPVHDSTQLTIVWTHKRNHSEARRYGVCRVARISICRRCPEGPGEGRKETRRSSHSRIYVMEVDIVRNKFPASHDRRGHVAVVWSGKSPNGTR